MKQRRRKQTIIDQKEISYLKLARESFPELWSFQFVCTIILIVVNAAAKKLTEILSGSADTGLSMANIKDFFLSWRTPFFIIVWLAAILVYILVQIFARIHLSTDIFHGEKTGVIKELKKALKSAGSFRNPAGILILLYLTVAVLICGTGFFIRPTDGVYVPDFIKETIHDKNQLFFIILYVILLMALLVIAYRYCFTIHGVLIDKMKPADAIRHSKNIIKTHGKKFILGMIRTLAELGAVRLLVYVLLQYIPELIVGSMEPAVKFNSIDTLFELLSGIVVGEAEIQYLRYNILCAFVVILADYFGTLTNLLLGAYFIFRFTKYYIDFSGETIRVFPERPKKSKYRMKIISTVLVTIAYFLFSIPFSVYAQQSFLLMGNVNIIEMQSELTANRMTSENADSAYYILESDKDIDNIVEIIKRNKQTEEPVYAELDTESFDEESAYAFAQRVINENIVSDIVVVSRDTELARKMKDQYPAIRTGTWFYAGMGNIKGINCDTFFVYGEDASKSLLNQITMLGKESIISISGYSGSEIYRLLIHNAPEKVLTDDVPIIKEQLDRLNSRTLLQQYQESRNEFSY